MNTCGTCKHRGRPIENMGEPTSYFLCERIKMPEYADYDAGKTAMVLDGSGYYGALCIEDDFGCVLWEGK